jgi:hypothetical protein
MKIRRNRGSFWSGIVSDFGRSYSMRLDAVAPEILEKEAYQGHNQYEPSYEEAIEIWERMGCPTTADGEPDYKLLRMRKLPKSEPSDIAKYRNRKN